MGNPSPKIVSKSKTAKTTVPVAKAKAKPLHVIKKVALKTKAQNHKAVTSNPCLQETLKARPFGWVFKF